MSEDVYKLVTVLGEEYEVTEEIKIGRSKSCRISLQDAQVSRHHATVWVESGKLYIMDENSSNGTFVNDVRIGGAVELKDGDKIKTGNMVIIVHAPYTEAKTKMAPEPQVKAEPAPAPKPKPGATPEKPPEEKGLEKKSSLLPLGLGVGGCLVILCVGVLCIALGYYLFFSNGASLFSRGRASTPVVAVALRTDGGDPVLSTYAGDPDENPFWLPVGVYYLEAFDQDETLLLMSGVTITDQSLGQGMVAFPLDFSSEGVYINAAQIEEIRDVFNFAISLDLCRLTFFEIASEDFSVPLYESAEDIQIEALDRLFALYDDMVSREDPSILALTHFEGRAATAGAWEQGGHMAVPSRGLFDSFVNFFGFARGAGERASQDVVGISALMTPQEKQDAFEMLPPALVGGATNYDEMIQKLKNGELNNNATQIRKNLMSDVGFAAAAQDFKKNGRPGLSIAHKEGAELVKRGAELQVEVVKKVLGDTLPGIDKGFDYADKVNEWAEFVKGAYTNPLGTLEGYTRGQVKGMISERIKNQLIKMGVPDYELDTLVDKLSDQVMAKIPEFTKPATPTPTVKPSKTPKPTKTTKPPPGPTDTPGPSPTPEPRDFSGAWNSGKVCDESDESAPYSWGISLTQEGTKVTGSYYEHRCPGGGRAYYNLEGTATDDAWLVLDGYKYDGRGDWGDESLYHIRFKIKFLGDPKFMNP
jgi:cell division septation protein DedD